MLCDLLTTHICDVNNNIHGVKAEHVGALKTINQVGNSSGSHYDPNIDLVSDDSTISIIAHSPEKRKISLSLADDAVKLDNIDDALLRSLKATSGSLEMRRDKDESKSSVYTISEPIEHYAGPKRPPAIILGKMDIKTEVIDSYPGSSVFKIIWKKHYSKQT